MPSPLPDFLDKKHREFETAKAEAARIAERGAIARAANDAKEVRKKALKRQQDVRELDFDVVERMAASACSIDDVMFILNVSTDSMRRAPYYAKKFKECYDRGQAQLRYMLLKAQVDKALSGDPRMLIWTGKQFLNQKEDYSTSGENVRTVELRHTLKCLTVDELRKLAGLGSDTPTPAQPAIEVEVKAIEGAAAPDDDDDGR